MLNHRIKFLSRKIQMANTNGRTHQLSIRSRIFLSSAFVKFQVLNKKKKNTNKQKRQKYLFALRQLSIPLPSIETFAVYVYILQILRYRADMRLGFLDFNNNLNNLYLLMLWVN